MSGFKLVPVEGGDPVHLLPGETVLGRGPLLGISDTRVSRNHGLLQNLNGLRLKPTHLNPCFVQSSLDDDPRPLQRGSWHQLRHGDLFSLLPGRLIFRVEAVEEEHTPRNSQNFEDEATRPDVESSPGVEPEQKQASPQPAAQNGGGSNRLSVKQDKPTQQVAGALEAPSAPRRRVLPAWMSAAVSAGSLSSVLKVPSPVKKNKQAAALAAKPATPTVTSLPGGAELSDEEEEEEEEPRRKMSKDEKRQSETGDPSESSVRFEPKPSRLKVTDKAAGHSASEQEDKEKSRPQVRTPCPYGKDCYRKNPVHFQECSHPGDPDYEEEDRPECPYGTDCYRKNPLHLQQFSHTKKPVRSTRNVTKLPPDEDEEDSGGDDSFINDDSEDVGDDSDFVPPDSDDSEQEDVQSLQKEAKAFLKKRK
uniref:Aprataxin and PNKP like factor n=1 Tax=Nothobranchius pienaari TaxID=704102 RepID=A0A1A8PZC6_9TELE